MEIKEVLDRLEEMLFSKGMVVQLCDSEVTDYERGRIYGQIEMLNKIKLNLENNDDEDSSL